MGENAPKCIYFYQKHISVNGAGFYFFIFLFQGLTGIPGNRGRVGARGEVVSDEINHRNV